MSKLPFRSQGQKASLGDRSERQPSSSPASSTPVWANFASHKFILGGGVAIFHLATSRVVVCYHSQEHHWFLPKGRRDVHETTEQGAEREGYEESGYRNRLLPLPIAHRQPQPYAPASSNTQLSHAFMTQPIWLQLMPLTATSQYLMYWYIAETLPPDVEAELNTAAETQHKRDGNDLLPYQYPPPFPASKSLKERIAMEPKGYEPVKHEGTGVDADEVLYVSYLLPIEEAKRKLESSVQRDVVTKGWEAIQKRLDMERNEASSSSNSL